MTFKAQKKPIIEELNRQRWAEEFNEWPMFGDRTPIKVPKHLEDH